MPRFFFLPAILGILSVANVRADLVYVSSHVPWLTQRNDSIVVKTQLDTAVLKGKRLKLDLIRSENGRARVITSRVFPIQEYSQEFRLGAIGTTMLGGRDFIRIAWSIVDTAVSGIIAPVGIVNIDKLPDVDTMQARLVRLTGGLKQIASVVKPDDFQKVGDFLAAPLWDSSGLYLVCSRPQGTPALTFVVDAKNAKNGYLAYADRFLTFHPANDSIETVRFARSISGDSLLYTRREWEHEMTSAASGDYFVVHIPWYDLGMIPPFIGRKVGFSIFARNATNTGAIPSTARKELPGSWGNLKFVQ